MLLDYVIYISLIPFDQISKRPVLYITKISIILNKFYAILRTTMQYIGIKVIIVIRLNKFNTRGLVIKHFVSSCSA